MRIADRFVPIPGIYLLNHSVGRPPQSAREQAGERFFTPWEQGAADVWPRWLAQLDGFRAALGQLLNGSADDFCPQSNLSSALTKVVHSLPRATAKSTLLLHEQDFPSMGFVLKSATKLGWKTRMIPFAANPLDLNTWSDHLGEDIAVALVTHVHSNTSAQLPVAEITRLCRERDVISVVDIAQSVGVVPIDLAQWQADFVLGSCVKWLCGGPGAGFLWAAPERVAQCEPIDLGWFSHADPFEFDINHFRYAEGALRFWGGTPSVLPFLVAANSIEVLLDIGIDTIRRHNVELGQVIIDGIDPTWMVSPAASALRGGTLVLNFGSAQSQIEDRLRDARVHFDSRPLGLRLSAHIYNSHAETNRVLDCLKP